MNTPSWIKLQICSLQQRDLNWFAVFKAIKRISPTPRCKQARWPNNTPSRSISCSITRSIAGSRNPGRTAPAALHCWVDFFASSLASRAAVRQKGELDQELDRSMVVIRWGIVAAGLMLGALPERDSGPSGAPPSLSALCSCAGRTPLIMLCECFAVSAERWWPLAQSKGDGPPHSPNRRNEKFGNVGQSVKSHPWPHDAVYLDGAELVHDSNLTTEGQVDYASRVLSG